MKGWDMFIPKTHLGQSSEPIRLVHISVPISHAFPPSSIICVTGHSSLFSLNRSYLSLLLIRGGVPSAAPYRLPFC